MDSRCRFECANPIELFVKSRYAQFQITDQLTEHRQLFRHNALSFLNSCDGITFLRQSFLVPSKKNNQRMTNMSHCTIITIIISTSITRDKLKLRCSASSGVMHGAGGRQFDGDSLHHIHIKSTLKKWQPENHFIIIAITRLPSTKAGIHFAASSDMLPRKTFSVTHRFGSIGPKYAQWPSDNHNKAPCG